ncbi:MAG: hypothetical protein CM1200mP10_29950 [Candidatus Neomarinimicrobiota bacterium]|nr:MAG: hypothetical protein CM1200mP10_29950 [Candidatus Neomarinimicrobiota bacterium]
MRRDIHKYPELGFDEHRTSGLVAEHMKNLGFDVETRYRQDRSNRKS